MFKCDVCEKMSKPNTRLTKIPVVLRQVRYEQEKGPSAHGQETVKEISVCEDCMEREESIQARTLSEVKVIEARERRD